MLQNALLNKLIENTVLGKKIQNSNKVSEKGKYALDATEKNPNIEGTIAEDVSNISNMIVRVKNTLNKIVALPDGASTAADAEIAAAKIGPRGEEYDTLQDAITKQIEDYKGVAVSNNQPSVDSAIDVWVNTNEDDDNDEFFDLPQVDDDTVSEDDTWSSKKINDEIVNLSNKVDEVATDRLILTSPDGTQFLIGVDVDGNIVTTRQ